MNPLLAAAVIALGARPESFVGSDPAAYSSWLVAKALAADAHDAGAPCEAASVTSRGGSAAGPPIMRAPPPAQFINESLVEHLRVAGCGRERLVNFLVFRTTTGEWMASRMLDGVSRTSALLQHDAMMGAAGAFTVAATKAGCPFDQQRATLKFGPVVQVAPPGVGGSWTEVWTASECGQTVAAEMTFTPDPRGGTTYSAKVTPPPAN